MDILAKQIDILDQKAAEIAHSRKLLLTLQKSIKSGMDAGGEDISIQYMPAEPIYIGEKNVYGGGENSYDALFRFYESLGSRADVDLIYPVWGVFSAERIKRGDWIGPDYYYLYFPDGRDLRPAALYAVGYMRAGYGQGSALYERMVRYIAQNGFEISGDTYEEYPLNEVSVADENNYLMRVMITVREKQEK
jgi:effector-binding domain-containing protein